MQRALHMMLDGVVGGVLGTGTQTLFLWAGQSLRLLRGFPPRRITYTALKKGGFVPKPKQTLALTTVLHLGFGTSAGAAFGFLASMLPSVRRLSLTGVLFGTLVWLFSYLGWVPALGFLPLPQYDQPTRPLILLPAHWVYGWTLGAYVARRQR